MQAKFWGQLLSTKFCFVLLKTYKCVLVVLQYMKCPHCACHYGLSRRLRAGAGGGGCFPMHCDSDEEVDGRRVSAICYLNPQWRQGDGGEVRTNLRKVDLMGCGRSVVESHSFPHVSERAMPWCICEHADDVRAGAQLRLYPFPRAPVDIAPLCDRMVLFPSTTMLHRRAPPHPAGAAAPHFHLNWLAGADAWERRRQGASVRAGSVLLHTVAVAVAGPPAAASLAAEPAAPDPHSRHACQTLECTLDSLPKSNCARGFVGRARVWSSA